jgi:predicted nucleic acid-binding protein
MPKEFSYPRDEDDEPYINLAVAVGADFIVSRDRDLLDLMTGYTVECKEFRQRFRSLKVIEPLEFLKSFEESESG